MDSFVAQQTRMRQRDRQQNVPFANGAPFLGIIVGPHDPERETVRVEYHGGQRDIQSMHPYTGSDSWIRVASETSSPVMLAQRPDSEAPELLSYTFRNPGALVDQFHNGHGVFRPLSPGEMEIHSRGTAQSFYSRRPLLEHRGGMVRTWLDQDELQSGAKAPLHVRNLHLHVSGELGDEERFGVVQRPDRASTFKTKFISADRAIDPALAASVAATAATSGVVVDPGPFAKEHTRILKTGSLFPPKLLDVREGDVVDDQGNVVNLSTTNAPLRYKGEWFMDGAQAGVFFVGIDKSGNFAVNLPQEAEAGGEMIIPSGDLLITIGKAHSVSVQKDYGLQTVDGSMTIDAKQEHNLTTREGNVTIKAAKAEIHMTAKSTTQIIKDKQIQLGGTADKAVLDSKLQTELTRIKGELDLFKLTYDLHQHQTTATVGPSAVPGVIAPPMVSFPSPSNPGATNSALVTIDS